MRLPLIAFALLLSLLIAPDAFAQQAGGGAGRRMNVLLIMADDLNNNMGLYGHPMVKTPHIDDLARRGMRFDAAYCQYPLCGPSRSSMLSGLRPDVIGVLNNGTHVRKHVPNVVTLPQMFRNNGYFAARVGKLYHYGVPNDIGTDGLDDPASWDKVVNPIGRDKREEDKIFSLVPNNFGGVLSWYASEGTDKEQTDGIGATEAIKLLEANKDRPFFLAVGFYRPHTPFVAPRKYFDMYPLDRIELAKVPADHDEHVPPASLGSRKPEEKKLDDRLSREAIQAYWASISFMDAQVGRVLEALDRLGLADNTVVVFTSDHGYHLGEHGLWKKQSIWENSARVPLVIAAPAPGIVAGKASSRPVELLDIYPTLAELCGLKLPDARPGRSLVPLLKDPNAPHKPGAVSQVRRGGGRRDKDGGVTGYAIRTERYRYVEWNEGRDGVQLYDMQSDPQELNNLADDPAHADTIREHRQLLRKMLE